MVKKVIDNNTGLLQIAIDGPVGAGKGAIAARLAKELHLVYIYTGAMYRALSLSCIRNGVDTKDVPKVLQILKNSHIELVEPDSRSIRPFKVLLNGNDVTDAIFAQDVAMGTSDVGTIPEVRKFMVKCQQEIAKGKKVVMEGRDIGFRVLPHAQLKIFLTATAEERAKRRYDQWKEKGVKKTYEEVLEETKKRDYQDTHREVDPLQKFPDMWELDSTCLSEEEVVKKIVNELKRRNLI